MAELQELCRYRRDFHRSRSSTSSLPQTIVAYIEGASAPLTCEG